MSHKYYIEEDIIEVSGSEALKRLSQGENEVYLDIDSIERRADDGKDKHQLQFQEALEFLHQGEVESSTSSILSPSGGRISWEGIDNERSIQEGIAHVTRRKGLQSKLKRSGIPNEFPDFLKYEYGRDVLDEGLIDVEYSGDPKKAKLDELLEERELFQNQLVRFNGCDELIYRVAYRLEEVRRGRWRIDEENGELKKMVPGHTGHIPGFKARNLEQKLGIQMLQDRNTEFHIIAGGSGSGKTVVSYAAAINMILSENKNRSQSYEGIVIFKPNNIIGGEDRGEGFLKGTSWEKNLPFFESYYDAHKYLGFDSEKGGIPFSELLADPQVEDSEFGRRKQHEMFQMNLPQYDRAIEPTVLSYSRGRTFEDKIVFIDEAQNYTPFEMKQLLERTGEGSKIFLVGDPEQIDNSKLDVEFNGLVYAANIFYGTHPRMSITKLNENYRSQTAEISRDKKAPKI